MQRGAGVERDSDNTRRIGRFIYSFEVEALEIKHIACAATEVDAIDARRQHAGGNSLAGNGHGFDDRNGAEAAGIEAVDFAAGRGLGNGARERLAWRGAAARVGVVAYA